MTSSLVMPQPEGIRGGLELLQLPVSGHGMASQNLADVPAVYS
jgi:hypothetical protein